MRADGFLSIRRALLAAALVILGAGAAMAQEAEAEEEEAPLSSGDITEEHVGEDVVVQSRVYRVARNRTGVYIYLDADTSTGFQAVIPLSAIPNWGGADPEKRYAQRRIVRASGEVEQQGETLFITVREPEQLRVIPRRRRR